LKALDRDYLHTEFQTDRFHGSGNIVQRLAIFILFNFLYSILVFFLNFSSIIFFLFSILSFILYERIIIINSQNMRKKKTPQFLYENLKIPVYKYKNL
jgi:hypothetical protein